MITRLTALIALLTITAFASAADPWVTYSGSKGGLAGKHVVLISGDEEYRSEEGLPQLGRILAQHHGARCTCLFAIDKDGTINPNVNNNIPGLDALKTADLMIILTRFRNLPDEQMKHIVDFVDAGKPIIGLRTATHAFNMKAGTKYAKYSWNNKEWDGGFGRQILGETWIAHHGAHGKEGCRGILAGSHEVTRGIKDGDIFGTSDVYTVRLPLPKGCTAVVLGQVTQTLESNSTAVAGKKNDPMMPVAWTTSYESDSGKKPRVFTTTMGASQDLSSEGLRRLVVNAAYWCLLMEVPAKAEVSIVGEFKPSPFKNNGFVKGVKPADLQLK